MSMEYGSTKYSTWKRFIWEDELLEKIVMYKSDDITQL